MRVVVPHGAGLRDGAIGAANEILLLPLDPEVRRIIGEIGQYRHQRNARQRLAQALAHGAVKIGHQRHHQIRPFFAPELFQQPHRAARDTAG